VAITSFLKRKFYVNPSFTNTKEWEGVPEDEKTYKRLCCYEFPWECFYGINFAFFRTFSSPTISGLYHRTKTIETTTGKRVNDTDILMHAWADFGVDSEIGSESWKHLNKIHGSFVGKTSNRDFVYVLCCFIVDTIRFINLFGWREVTKEEEQGIFTFWVKVGDRMELKNLPKTLEDSFEIVEEYVKSDLTSSVTEGGKVLTESITQLLMKWYWFVPKPVVREGTKALLFLIGGETFVRKLGLPMPSDTMLFVIKTGALIRRNIMQFVPPRYTQHRLSAKLMKQDYSSEISKSNLAKVGPPKVISHFNI